MTNTTEKISTYITQGTALDLDQEDLYRLIKKAIVKAVYTQERFGMIYEVVEYMRSHSEEYVAEVWEEFFTSEDEECLQTIADNVVKNHRHGTMQRTRRFESYDRQGTDEEGEEYMLEGLPDLAALDPFDLAMIKTDIGDAIAKHWNQNGNTRKLDLEAALKYAFLILDGVYPVKAMELSGLGYTPHRKINKLIFEYFKS